MTIRGISRIFLLAPWKLNLHKNGPTTDEQRKSMREHARKMQSQMSRIKR